jgi:hypothetical protein
MRPTAAIFSRMSGAAMIRFISVCSRSTIGLGVFDGISNMCQDHAFVIRRAGCFRERRHIGQQREALRRRHRQRAQVIR